jgi:glycosyltransferase involved in cell wall biosynthesis
LEKISNQDSKHILLISYTFPPYPGIGGRRWAKFSKYLSRLGYTVHVIHAKNPFKEQSLWTEDIENEKNIKRYELNSLYPKVLLTQPKSILQKLNYKISLLIVRFLSKGTLYDRGIFWKKPILSLAAKLIEKYKIKNVIVSCAPFSTAYHTLTLKKKFKELNLIVDFRDPWTWGSVYGFANIAAKRLKHEKMMENAVVEKADKITVPVEIMKQQLLFDYEKKSNKIALLPHAYDEEEVVAKAQTSDDMITIIFYGNLYSGIKDYLVAISNSIKKIKNKIRLEIYSDTDRYSEIFEENNLLNTSVFFYKNLSTKQLFQKIKFSHFVLLVHPDRGIDNISTKFYEIINSRTPILYVSKPGNTSEFIVTKKLGYFFEKHQIENNFEQIVFGNVPYEYNKNYNVSEFSFTSVTQLLKSYLTE